MITWLCDWTHWQSITLPAPGVADEGFGCVKLKVGGATREGRYFEDPKFYDNAVALLAEPRLIPGAYWYLMPGRTVAQAALFYDMLSRVDLPSWGCWLDVEEPGLSWQDVLRFAWAWETLVPNKPLVLYTRKTHWTTLKAPPGAGADVVPLLEQARWVPKTVRDNESKPYASQHYRHVLPTWWNVDYGGWKTAHILQFTDTARVQGKRTVASAFRGTKDELRAMLGIPQVHVPGL